MCPHQTIVNGSHIKILALFLGPTFISAGIEYFLLVCIYKHVHVDCFVTVMDYILVASLGHGLCNINLALKENNSRLFCYRLYKS